MDKYLNAPDGDGYWWWRANGDDEPQLTHVIGFSVGNPRAYFCIGGIITPPFWGCWERAVVKQPGDKEKSLLADLIKTSEEIRLLTRAALSIDPLGHSGTAFESCRKMIDELVEKYK